MFKHVIAGAISHLPFSPAVMVGDLVFVSGQASVDAESGAIISDTFEGEMRRSFENLLRVLRSTDCEFSNLVSVRCYLDKQERLCEFNEIYRNMIPAPYPARTTLIGVLGSDFLKFEVDAIAHRQASAQPG
ncbi:MAG: RidA family protein [Pirellulales bacterium]|nr:RidA family protein [Pirellulales bacterium]